MRKVNMVDRGKQVFLPVPHNYYDLTDEQQLAVCEDLAKVLIAELGEPVRDSNAVKNESPNRES
jgi:hypothetical protein